MHPPASSHQVCFTDVLGFVTPACQTVTVTLGNTTIVVGNYVQLGLIQVAVSPPGLPVDVLINGVPRNQFGAYLFIEAGSCWRIRLSRSGSNGPVPGDVQGT